MTLPLPVPSDELIRTNIFISKRIDNFIKQEAKRQKVNKGRVIEMGIRALEKEQLKASIKEYYTNSGNIIREKNLAEEGLSLS